MSSPFPTSCHFMVVCLSTFSRRTSASSTPMLRRYCCHAIRTSPVQFAKEALLSGIASCISRVASRELTHCIPHVGCLPLAVHVDMISTLTARPIRTPLSVRHAPAVVGITPGSAPGSGQRHQTPQTCWRCREEKKNARGAEAYSDKLFCVEQKSRVNPIRSCRLRRL